MIRNLEFKASDVVGMGTHHVANTDPDCIPAKKIIQIVCLKAEGLTTVATGLISCAMSILKPNASASPLDYGICSLDGVD